MKKVDFLLVNIDLKLIFKGVRNNIYLLLLFKCILLCLSVSYSVFVVLK